LKPRLGIVLRSGALALFAGFLPAAAQDILITAPVVIAADQTWHAAAGRWVEQGSGNTGALQMNAGTTLTLTGFGLFGIGSPQGSGALVIDGPVFQAWGGSTPWAGTTTLNAGRLRITSGATPFATTGGGALILNGGIIGSGNNVNRTIPKAVTIGGDIGIASGDDTTTGFYATGFGTGTVTFSGPVDLGGGTRRINAGVSTTFSGGISNGAITKAGNAEIHINSTADWQGSVTIEQGRLAVTHAGGLNGLPDLVVAAGASLSLGNGFNGGTATIGHLTGEGTVDPAYGSTTATTRTLCVTQTNDGGFAGTLADSGSRLLALRKEGGGRLTLSGTSSHTGPTRVEAGTLAVTGSIGNSAVTVAAGATLAGQGNLGGSVTLETLANHGLEIASTPSSQVTRIIGGPLTMQAGNRLVLTASGIPAVGTYRLVTANGGISGSPGTVILPAGLKGNAVVRGNHLELDVTGTDYGDWSGPGDWNLSGGPAEDDDGDGLSNFAEYAFGLNPTIGSSVSPITAPNRTTGIFTYTRRKPSLTGLAYTYKSSTTLADWSDFTPANESTDSGNPVETVTVTIPAALLTADRLYLRVEAHAP
jgi:autotransporter-associated beta strand protein